MNDNIIVLGKLIFSMSNYGLLEVEYMKQICVDNSIVIRENKYRLESWQLKFENLIKLLIRDRIGLVVIEGSSSYLSFMRRIARFLEATLQISVLINSTSKNENLPSASPFINGLRLFITGIYPVEMIYDGIKHIDACFSSPYNLASLNLNNSLIDLSNSECRNPNISEYYLEKLTLIGSYVVHEKFNYPSQKIIFSDFKSRFDKFRDWKKDINVVNISTLADLALMNNFFQKSYNLGTISVADCQWLLSDEVYCSDYKESSNRLVNNSFLSINRDKINVDSYILKVRHAVRGLYNSKSKKIQDQDTVSFLSIKKHKEFYHLIDSLNTVNREFCIFKIKGVVYLFSGRENKYYTINKELQIILEASLFFTSSKDFFRLLDMLPIRYNKEIVLKVLLKYNIIFEKE
ncbi:hypothetical protein AB3329_00885 [Streptococcus sp. H31]|uniref:hypothetical protein n=1 Tax=Streptococcus huangxiaojuni TaxID=3237239 RepID=UPI0034A398F7